MTKSDDLGKIKQLLDIAEGNIRQAKNILFSTEINQKAKNLNLDDSGETVEGIFDGEEMVGPNKSYPIPANYASKSKLIPGDVLKLTILGDGSFVFKQIGPVARKKLVGDLEEIDDSKYVVNVDDKKYSVLLASVTYFKAKSGDKLTIIVPEKNDSEWAAVENLLERKEQNEK